MASGTYYALLALFRVEQAKFVSAFYKRQAATGAHKPTADEIELWKATYNQISNLKEALEAYIVENDDLFTGAPKGTKL